MDEPVGERVFKNNVKKKTSMFRNADHALSWAYETIEKPIVKLSSINGMRREQTRGMPNGLLIGLTAEDLHRQAANIISMVGQLNDTAAQEYIAARFGNRHQKENLTILAYRGCAALGVGLSNQDAVYKVIKSYFTGKQSYRDLRKDLKCRDQYALMARKCIYDTLDIIHHRAMADISGIFEEQGLIVSSVRMYSN